MPRDRDDEQGDALMEANREQRRATKKIGAALAAGAAAGGLLVYLRRRAHQVAATLPVDPMVGPMDGLDGPEPDVIHAAGHRHRAPEPSPGLHPPAAEHELAPPIRHRDRGGRATAFHTRRSM